MALHEYKQKKAHFSRSCAGLINIVMGLAPVALLAAVQSPAAAATAITDLETAILAITGLKEKDKHYLRLLAGNVRQCYEAGLITAAEIVALTTVNTAAAATDLLYAIGTRYDSNIDNTFTGAPQHYGSHSGLV